jgi:hypothetical protein
VAQAPWEKSTSSSQTSCRIQTNDPKLDHAERARKKAAREGHKASEDAQKLTGLRYISFHTISRGLQLRDDGYGKVIRLTFCSAKLMQKKRHSEKIQMKKQIKAHGPSPYLAFLFSLGNLSLYPKNILRDCLPNNESQMNAMSSLRRLLNPQALHYHNISSIDQIPQPPKVGFPLHNIPTAILNSVLESERF